MVDLQKYLFENKYKFHKIYVGDAVFLIVSEQEVFPTIKTNRNEWDEYIDTGIHTTAN